jgi:hypothetical protein
MSTFHINLKITDHKELCVEYFDNDLCARKFYWTSLNTEKILKRLSELTTDEDGKAQDKLEMISETWIDTGESCQIKYNHWDGDTYIDIVNEPGMLMYGRFCKLEEMREMIRNLDRDINTKY